MGVMSRTVVPVCESLCVFCPSLRTRSRQPIKRYKKILADIFPKSQDEAPNDRKIGKLSEYASKNPLRIPKISNYLEQRCYKELRHENFNSAKIVICIYRRLLVSCKEQMLLFSSSLLTIIHTLLDQTRHEEMQIEGCHALFDLINSQTDGSYMFDLENLIPTLCQLAQGMGTDEMAVHLRAAALQALASMVWFMGEHSHISAEFDNIVTIVLENYEVPHRNSEDGNLESKWVQEVLKTEGNAFPGPGAMPMVPSWNEIVNNKGELNLATEESKSPYFWSRVCVHNMARLAKEATIVRRVLESLFRFFDSGDLWPLQNGLALFVLLDMQTQMENSGQNTNLIRSILVKHLDHKTVSKQPEMQLNIVEITTYLAQNSKSEASFAVTAAITDIVRQLRRSMQISEGNKNLDSDTIKWNKKYREAVDQCLVQLSKKVGEAGPLLDMITVMLENLSTNASVARATISALYRTAQIIASLPNPSYQNKAFPEALFHHLLLAMVHPDRETHVGAHRIFSVLLVPSSVCPCPGASTADPSAHDLQRTLSRTVSVFSSSAALFGKLRREISSSRRSSTQENLDLLSNTNNDKQSTNANVMIYNLKPSQSRILSLKDVTSSSNEEQNPSSTSLKDMDPTSLRLSSHQIALMLSSIWVQSISPVNIPENYEAIAHTYCLTLLFARSKSSSREALVRSFQLAFSLRSISLGGGALPPSRRRSLFTLAISMIVFSSRAFNILPLVPIVKSSFNRNTVDPFLCLVDDSKLQAVNPVSSLLPQIYGSKEDDKAALSSLSAISLTEDQSKESIISLILNSLEGLSESESTSMKQQLICDFLPDDVCPLGAQFVEAPGQIYTFSPKKEYPTQEKVMPKLITFEDDVAEGFDVPEDSKSNLIDTNLLGVNQLLDPVLDTAVGRMSVCTTPDVPFKEMASHCEALVMGKQKKMSVFMSGQQKQDDCLSSITQEQPEVSQSSNLWPDQLPMVGNAYLEVNSQQPYAGPRLPCATESQFQYQFHQPEFLRLPASSPYDNFLKAAGC